MYSPSGNKNTSFPREREIDSERESQTHPLSVSDLNKRCETASPGIPPTHRNHRQDPSPQSPPPPSPEPHIDSWPVAGPLPFPLTAHSCPAGQENPAELNFNFNTITPLPGSPPSLRGWMNHECTILQIPTINTRGAWTRANRLSTRHQATLAFPPSHRTTTTRIQRTCYSSYTTTTSPQGQSTSTPSPLDPHLLLLQRELAINDVPCAPLAPPCTSIHRVRPLAPRPRAASLVLLEGLLGPVPHLLALLDFNVVEPLLGPHQSEPAACRIDV